MTTKTTEETFLPTTLVEHEGRTTRHRPAVAEVVEGDLGPTKGAVVWKGVETFRSRRAAMKEAVRAWVFGEHRPEVEEVVTDGNV